MQTIQIIREAFGNILAHPWMALRATVGPLLLALMPFLVLAVLLILLDDTPSSSGDALFDISGFIAVLVSFLCVCWAAVAWHRVVLLGERPGLLPKFHLKRILHYVWCAMVIWLLSSLLCAYPFSSLIINPLLENSPEAANLFISGRFGIWDLDFGNPWSLLLLSLMFLALFLPWYVLLRFSPVLPAAAIGKPIWCGKAWRATRDRQGSIALLAVGYAVVGLSVLSAALRGTVVLHLGVIGLPIMLIFGWTFLIISLSFITVIYRRVVAEVDGAT